MRTYQVWEQTYPRDPGPHNDNIVLNAPWGSLTHLGLARAFTMQGDRAKARIAYQDFFALWKDADPDIPILLHAKSEYANLK